MSNEPFKFEISMLPPSVNHYKEPQIIRRGRFHSLRWKLTPEGLLFKARVYRLIHGNTIAPALAKDRRKTRYRLEVRIYLGKGKSGDGDNFWKVIADSLVEAGLIHTDAAVDEWFLWKYRDRENPRTVITATVLETT